LLGGLLVLSLRFPVLVALIGLQLFFRLGQLQLHLRQLHTLRAPQADAGVQQIGFDLQRLDPLGVAHGRQLCAALLLLGLLLEAGDFLGVVSGLGRSRSRLVLLCLLIRLVLGVAGVAGLLSVEGLLP